MVSGPFLQTCPECNGDAAVPNPAWKPYRRMTEEEYARAMREGEIDNLGPEELPCGECEGRGRVPTLEAAPILELIYWWWSGLVVTSRTTWRLR